jgi:hypothetical protein
MCIVGSNWYWVLDLAASNSRLSSEVCGCIDGNTALHRSHPLIVVYGTTNLLLVLFEKVLVVLQYAYSRFKLVLAAEPSCY